MQRERQDSCLDSTEELSRHSAAPRAATTLFGLTILGHPDGSRVGERAVLAGLEIGERAGLSRLEPLFAAPGQTSSPRPLEHRRLSRRPLMLEAAEGRGVRLRREESGTVATVDGEALVEEFVFGPERLAHGVVLLLGGRVVLLLHRLQPLIDPKLPHFGLIGESLAMQTLRHRLRQVADLDVSVLLRGESGTGKELAARALHDGGSRRDRPFVAVNMAAVPPSLAASELFGAARGAFTGADRARPGYFTRADGGTLFLDEVGEMPVEVQTVLLRCLESGEVQPVGDAAPRRVDVRVVAATDADLEKAVADGRFRAPLLHRLAGFVIPLPPLRERRDDIGRLLARFLEQELAAVGESGRLTADPPWLPAEITARLARLDWPGNVRQLRNVVRQLVIDCRGADIARLDPALDALLEQGTASVEEASRPDHDASPAKPIRRPLDEISDDELLAALRAERWRPHAAARRLGIPRPSIYHLMHKCPRVRVASELERAELEPLRERHGDDLAAMAAELEVSELALRRRLGELGL